MITSPEPQTDPQGRVALAAYRLRRLVVHGNDFAGMHDLQRKSYAAGMAVDYGGEVRWEGIIIFGLCGILFFGVSGFTLSRVGEGRPLTPETGRYSVLSCAEGATLACLLYQKNEETRYYRFSEKMRRGTLENRPLRRAVLEVYEVSGRLHVRQIRPGREDY